MMIAYSAMMLASRLHKEQKRKYTNNPYFDHLAEVAGIVSTVSETQNSMAVAWLHDSIEDCGVSIDDLVRMLGYGVNAETIAAGVWWLSDTEDGKNRAERKAKSRDRLAKAPGWIQTIKCADLISNTSSIMQHDAKFAVTYLEEKRLLLDVLTNADVRLLEMASNNCAKTN